ncbi:unnamed protein product [Schistosoma spindalis]|nr:unnamed protein product [Schistosoma spindale]
MPIQLDNKSAFNLERLDRSSIRNGVQPTGEHPEGISPLEAVNLYRDNLSLHERKEILRYEKIFYVGCTADKHSISNCSQFSMQKFNNQILQYSNDKVNPYHNNNNSNHNTNNNNPDNQSMFNDSDNFYRIIQHDHIAYRYEILSLLGKGSFGQVVSAYDHMKGCKVALKIIRTEPRFTRQAREEIRILETLRNMRESSGGELNRYDFPIINLYEHFTFRKHICMTFELLNINLYDLLKLNKFNGLPRDRVRRICFQVLKALQFIQKAGIIHCDLKPENILLVWPQLPENESTNNNNSNNINQQNSHHQYGDNYYKKCQQHQNHYNGNNNNGYDPLNNLRSMYQRVTEQKDYVKLIDFGSSCFQNGQPYPYIQSRFYRAPEILLRLGYNEAIDTWSFGCLVAELINGLPLFPGEDETDQMACIMEVLGLPHPTLLRHSSELDRYFIEFKCDKLKPSTLEFMDKKGVRLSRDVVYLPRYCSVRYPDGDSPPQLLPGISKRGGHVRGIPSSLPLLQAITQSRLRRYKRKDTRSVSNLSSTINTAKMSEEEEIYLDKDNELVVNLLSSCLTWLPDERIQSNKAIMHPWFNHFYNNKSTIGFRSQVRVRSMEVSKFAPNNSKLANEINERHLLHDHRNGHESLNKDSLLHKINGLCNSGRQKTSRLNLINSHLVNFDIIHNNSIVDDSVRNNPETDVAPCMVDTQSSPIQEEELKKTRRNSQITIVQQQPSYLVTVSNSPNTCSKNLSHSTQHTDKMSSSGNRHVTFIYSNNMNSNVIDNRTIATAATMTTTTVATIANSSNQCADNKSIVPDDNQEGQLLSVNLSFNHLNSDNNISSNIDGACDDVTISNTTSSNIIHMNKNILNDSTINNSSSTINSSINSNANTSALDVLLQHSDLVTSVRRSSLIGSLTEINNLNGTQSEVIVEKTRPLIHTKPDAIYQSKKLSDRNSTSNNDRPLSEFTHHHHQNNQHPVTDHGKNKIITENESDSPTFLITGHCSDSTPHLPNLMSFNINHTNNNTNSTNATVCKITNSPNRYSYSNLHQSVPFVSSLTIDKSLNNSMNNIVSIQKMKPATDVTMINASAKRYSVPTRSRLIDIPQAEYEIPIIDHNNSSINYNHINDYAKQDIHFIPVTSSHVIISTDSGVLHKLNTTCNNSTSNITSNGLYRYPSSYYNQQQCDAYHNHKNNYQYRQQQPPSSQSVQLQHQEQFNRQTSCWLANNSNNNNNCYSNNNRKILNFTRNLTDPKEHSLNSHSNGINSTITGMNSCGTINSTIILPEIAPKPPVRTKLIISNSSNNDTSNNTDYKNTIRWRSVKSLSSEDYGSANLYGPQPYSQPPIESHKIIVQRLPQFNLNNNNNNNGHGGYTDQISSHYTQYET